MWIEFGAERALDRPIVRKSQSTPLRIVELGHLRTLDIAPVKLPIVIEKDPALVQIWEQRCRGSGCERNGKQSQCTTQVKNQTSSHRGTKSSVSFVNCVILRSLPTHPRWLSLMERREMPAHLSLRVSGFLVVKKDLCMKREICRESPLLCRETAYLFWRILDISHIFGLGKCGRQTDRSHENARAVG
jgi:hypothetical protein